MREWTKPASTGLLGLSLLFLCLFVYLSKIPLNYTYDGMVFAARVENEHAHLWDLFHPHHLLYTFLGHLLFLWGKNHGATWDGLVTLQSMDLAIGLFGIGTAFHLLVRETNNRPVAALSALGLGFSYSYWYFSTSPGVRIFAAVTPLFAWYVLTYLKNFKPWFGLAVGSAHALAVLGHQTNLYLLPAFLGGLWCLSEKSIWDRFKASLYYLCALSFWVLGVYGFVGRFALSRTTYPKWVAWIMSYSHIPGWPRGNFGPSGIAMAKYGTSQAFLMTAIPEKTMCRNLPDSLLQAFAGLGFHGGAGSGFSPVDPTGAVMPLTFQAAQVFFQYGLLILLGFLLVRLDVFIKYHRQAVWVALFWLLPFVPFFIWWDPDNIEFWVTTTPPCWMLMGVVVSEISNRWKNPILHFTTRSMVTLLWAGLIGCLFLYNFNSLFKPRPAPATHDRRPLMSALDWKVRRDDLLVLDGINTIPMYLDRFQKREYLGLYPFFRQYQIKEKRELEARKNLKNLPTPEMDATPVPTPDPWKDLQGLFERKWKHHRRVWILKEAEDPNDAWRSKLEKMLNMPQGRMTDFFSQYGLEPVTYRGKVYFDQVIQSTPTPSTLPGESTPTPAPAGGKGKSKSWKKH